MGKLVVSKYTDEVGKKIYQTVNDRDSVLKDNPNCNAELTWRVVGDRERNRDSYRSKSQKIDSGSSG
ncbi:MAG: hypothetical protein ABEJ03_04660 [Candidatus Nanohaloarchaea archaeon]